MLPLTGYSDRHSARQGETLAFKLSTSQPTRVSARLVRVICGDPNPAGPGIVEQDLSATFSTEVQVAPQPVYLGSYAQVNVEDLFEEHNQFTVHARIFATTPNKGRQGLISHIDPETLIGFALIIDDQGALAALVSNDRQEIHEVSTERSLRSHCWYRVTASIDVSTGKVTVAQQPLDGSFGQQDSAAVESTIRHMSSLNCTAPVIVSALGNIPVQDHFNGKIETPTITRGIHTADQIDTMWESRSFDACLLALDLSIGIDTPIVHDVSPSSCHGKVVNLPSRAMTGSRWAGEEMCWRHKPEHYGAIHFHDDDLYDCDWSTNIEFKVPKDLQSGAYALRLSCQIDESTVDDMIPFFVTTAPENATANLCVLIPTFTYTVYGNHARDNTDAAYRDKVARWNARPWTPDDYPQYGASTYNFHSDGSGIAYASRLRPMMTMRSGYVTFAEDFTGSGLRHFPADTHLFSWLHAKKHDFDVLTDEDLHERGVACLQPYKAVLTSTHPEYHTRETLNAVRDYTREGGRLAYLGGNGYYWRVAISDAYPGAVEIRRGEGGIRAWAAEPGEYYNAFDGEYGGLWRRNGRPPQQLVGIGFSAQGLFQGSFYRKTAAASDPQYAWIFSGVDDDIIGDFGLNGGGAAGFELDRHDERLGSPPGSVILATSEQHAEHFVAVPEETLTHTRNWNNEPTERLIRADMLYFQTPREGAVFSTGSITFCGALPVNGFHNNVSQILDNVVRRFLNQD